MGCPEHDEIVEDISHLNDSFNDFKDSVTKLTMSIEKLGETTISIQQYYEQNKQLTDQNAQIRMDLDKLRTWLKVIAIVGIVGFTILFGMHGLDIPKLL